jgi:NADH-quinone oxidoreductase subunit J
MNSIFLYIFATMMLSGALMVVLLRNPVSSALAMVLSFIGLAGIFTGLNAYLIGILQILVYAGAIMVLFIFIIMLLDLKKEEKLPRSSKAVLAGALIPAILIIQLIAVLSTNQNSPTAPELQLTEAAANYKEDSVIHKKLTSGSLPDVHLLGRKLYTDYNFPLQMVAVLLLSATIGCVTLSKKSTK